MMDRRQFLSSAGAFLTFPVSQGFAANYDLVIKGGRVIDPSLGVDRACDVVISNGRVAAVETGISAEGASRVLDARNRLVVPGLIDVHAHAARTSDQPLIMLGDGVTAFADPGSVGADHVDDAAAVIRSAPNLVRVLINIARVGGQRAGELKDLSNADVAATRAGIERCRDYVIGVKARLSVDVADANDYEGLKRAQEAATPYGLPVMIHMGQTATPLPKLLSLLKPGDIVTHMFAPPPNAIVDDNGRLLPDVLAARRRGVWFDLGHGRNGHFRWDILDSVLQQGFLPDTFSTDWLPEARNVQVLNFPNVLSKFLMLGMQLNEVIARATTRAARLFEAFSDRGTLNVGAPADVTILELRDGEFTFDDNYGGKRTGSQRLFPSATVVGGKVTA